jgi:hypothetical protein
VCVVWRAALALDARLSSYLLAYLLSQLPSVAHRMCQVAGDAPQWLAFAQSATQPAQGLLNLVVFSHHGLGSSQSLRGLARRCCCCRRRERSSTEVANSF